MLQKLNSATLDKIEDRFVQGCLGDTEISGSVLEILRRVLHQNGRLSSFPEAPGDPQEILDECDADEDMPDYGGKIVNFK